MMIIFGDDSFKYVKSTSVLIASVEYILSTKCFDVPFIKIDTCLLVYMQFIFSLFIKKLLCLSICS